MSWWRAVMGGVLLAAAGCVLPKAAFWVASLGAVLAAVGVVYAVRRREKGRLWAVAAVFAGMLLPGLVQLGWIWQFNDLGRFWFCNVVVNGKYSGYLFKNMEILKLAIRWALYWPAVPTFLAAVGIPAIILSQGPLAWPRKLVAAALVVSSGAFVLTVGGPFAQNHLPLLMILCGLGGAGLAAILSRWNIGHRLAASVLVAVLASGCIWTGRDLLDSSLLRASVAPYQYVLNQAKPGDTYIGMTHFNPVFVMDADPTHFAYLLCFHEPADFAAMHRLILKKWPRFVIGFGTPLFVAGQGVRVVQVNNDSDGRQIMRHYQQVNPCVLERRDVLGGQ